MWYKLLALILFSIPTCYADNLSDVATQALKVARNQPHGDLWEYGGIIILHDGKLYYTASPVTRKSWDSVDINANKMRGDNPLVAVYHTHPCYSDSHYPGYFSRQDLIQAFFFFSPTFILDQCTGEVHKFDPHHIVRSDNDILVEDHGRPIRLLYGEVVGNIHQQSFNMDLMIAAHQS